MRDSQVVQEWIAEGEIKGKIKGEIKGEIKALLRLLEKKFPPGAPADLAGIIQACTEQTQLAHWLDAAIDAASLDDFRRAIAS